MNQQKKITDFFKNPNCQATEIDENQITRTVLNAEMSSNASRNEVNEVVIYYQNANGLRTKTNTFKQAVAINNFKIYVLTETGLNDTMFDNEVFTSDYVVYRCDRVIGITSDKIQKGGVLIAVHVSMQSSLVSRCNDFGIEQLWIKVNIFGKNIFICALYIPPQSKIELYKAHITSITSAITQLNENDICVIIGDFNLRDIIWCEDENDDNVTSYLLPINVKSDIEICVVDQLMAEGFNQISNIYNSNMRWLDLVFTNESDNVNVTCSTSNLLPNEIHHKALEINLSVQELVSANEPQTLSRRNFFKADYEKLNNLIVEVDWSVLFMNSTMDDSISRFYDKMLELFDQSVPLVRKTVNNHPKYFDKCLINLKNRTNKALKTYKDTGLDSDYCIYSDLRKDLKTYSYHAYQRYIAKLGNEMKHNPKSFFNYVNEKRKTNGFPTNMTFDNRTSSDPIEISNLFADFFSDVYVKSHDNNIDSESFQYLDRCKKIKNMPVISISESILLTEMKTMKSSNSPGPDGIPSIVLKNCSDAMMIPLHMLFNKSLVEETFPDIWKLTYLWPRYKTGKRSMVENYRGIAKLSEIPKLFEKLVCDQLYIYAQPIIYTQQHGFMKGRSTATNLVEFTSFAKKSIEMGFQVDVIFTDFSKAFDKMIHKILLFKLEKLGFNTSILNWIRSYLHKRMQFVKFGSCDSKSFIVSSGIGQGTHLGPLFFVLMINDLITFIMSPNDLLFADDNKLYARISCIKDCRRLQENIDSVNKWCMLNKLFLNIEKCEVMTFTRQLSGGILHQYKIGSKDLTRVTTKLDLGVFFDQKLNFIQDIDRRIAKAYGMMGFVIRCSKEFDDPYVTKSLYCCFVRPILEYASEVWCPHYEVHGTRIESIQKKFLLFALRDLGWSNRFELPSYKNRLKLLHMNTLKHRREVAMVMFIFKLIKGLIDAPKLYSKLDFINNSTSASVSKFYIAYHRTNYGTFEPINFMCKLFNEYFDMININNSVKVQREKLLDLERNSSL